MSRDSHHTYFDFRGVLKNAFSERVPLRTVSLSELFWEFEHVYRLRCLEPYSHIFARPFIKCFEMYV